MAGEFCGVKRFQDFPFCKCCGLGSFVLPLSSFCNIYRLYGNMYWNPVLSEVSFLTSFWPELFSGGSCPGAVDRLLTLIKKKLCAVFISCCIIHSLTVLSCIKGRNISFLNGLSN